jgi:hypothetical protein
MWRLSLFLCGTGTGKRPSCLTKWKRGQKRRAPGRDGAGGGAKPLISKGLINHVAGPQAFAIVRQLQSMAGGLMAHETDYQPGSMDISAHVKAYKGFLTGTKWTFGFIMLIMVFLAIFRTHG